jgi:hypothetical protein
MKNSNLLFFVFYHITGLRLCTQLCPPPLHLRRRSREQRVDYVFRVALDYVGADANDVHVADIHTRIAFA